MNKKELQDIVRSIDAAEKRRQKQNKPTPYYEYSPAAVKKLRKRCGVTQPRFALLIGVNLVTVQNWEQGKRKPSTAANALLRVLDKHPEAVIDAIHHRAYEKYGPI